MNSRACLPMAAVAALCLFSAACERDQQITSPPSLQVASLGASIGDSAVDLLESRMGLPPSPRPYDTSDVALEEAVRAAGGLAFVAFKSQAASHSSDAGGLRARVSVSDVRQALQMLASRPDVQVLNFYRMLGIARVRLAPGAAVGLRGSRFADFVEPAFDVVVPSEPHPGLRPAGIGTVRMSASSGTQVVPWNAIQVQAPAAWPFSTGVTTKVMMIFKGLATGDADFPNVPSGNCGGYLNACGGAPFANGTLQFGVMFPRDNSFGIVGVAPGGQGSNIYLWNPYSHQEPDTLSINMEAAGLNQAVQSGVRVVFMDFVHDQYSSMEAAAIAQAYAAGATIVSGMGIFGQYRSQTYPGSYPNVISVSGVRPNGAFAGAGTCDANKWASGSDYGPMVTLAAPISAYTTYGNGYYYDLWNSWANHICNPSLSAAHVAAVAALLQDYHPSWNPAQILARLKATASGGGGRINDQLGYGLVNAYAAVYPPPPPPPSISVTSSGPNPVPAATYCTWVAGASGGAEPYSYQWQVNGSPAGDGSNTMSITSPGTDFTITVTATDAHGLSGSASVLISVGGVTSCNIL